MGLQVLDGKQLEDREVQLDTKMKMGQFFLIRGTVRNWGTKYDS